MDVLLCRFTQIGTNVITAKGGRTETINLAAAEQIAVQVGDLIGFYAQSTGFAEIPYDECSDATINWKYMFDWTPSCVVGSSYTFKTVWWYYCRLMSFTATIGPSPT